MTIDVNVSISRWPFRRLPADDISDVTARLRQSGITRAWVGSFDALLHKDIDGVNRRLAEACRAVPDGLLRPFGTLNPTLPDWREDLRRCQEEFRMPGIRLHPNYHGYRLEDPVFAELLVAAAARRMVVQLAVRMEDPRMQHPLVRVPDVDCGPLPDVVAKCPNSRLVLLNGMQVVTGAAMTALMKTGRVYVEISTLEGMGGVSNLLTRVPLERILFGSHFPYFLLESALLKLRESDLSPVQRTTITCGNAAGLLLSSQTSP